MEADKARQAAAVMARSVADALEAAGDLPPELKEAVDLLEESAEKIIEYLAPSSIAHTVLTLRAAAAAVEGNSATRAVESKSTRGRLKAKETALAQ
ncbi:MAG: hypothetical protein J2P41_00730 [Blastocatellia bacterium]|nr:hypothetical protein [Blastocatellia bacterium]